MVVLFEVKLKDEWFKEYIMRRRPTRPGMTRPTRGGVNPRRPGMTRPMPTRVGTAGTPVPRGPAPKPAPTPMPTRGGKGMNPSGLAPKPAPMGGPVPTPMPTRGGVGMNPRGPAPRPAPTPTPTRGGGGRPGILPGRENVRTARPGMKKGGSVKKASSCSKRADGCVVRGKTKGRMI